MNRRCSVPGCERSGTTGGDCIPHKFEGGIRVNGIALFRHDREHGLTQMQKVREMYDASKADKVDIQQVRGRRTPHEKKTAAGWEKQ
jgi:hypothetical protein